MRIFKTLKLPSILLVLTFMSASCSAQVKSKTFQGTIDGLLSETVDTIGIQRFEKLMKSETEIVILDAREPKEFETSHIEGAKCVGYEELDLSALESTKKNTPIVVYCSIGYRSEKVGEKLEEKGFTNVMNLYGGIFEWVNHNGAVEQNGTTTKQIHGYDKWWSRFLERGEIILD